MKFRKLLLILAVLVICMCLPVVGLAADELDTREVKELRTITRNCYYRESPPNGEKVLEAEEGDTVYVIEEYTVSLQEDFPIIYLLCNTEKGKLWIWEGFTEYEIITYKSNYKQTPTNNHVASEDGMIYVGKFKCTTYCPCDICNEGWGTTATGNPLTPWYTIAVDPRVIPLGSTVYIEGLGTFKAHDTGGAIKGHKIDVCISSHAEAQYTTYYDMQVYIVN